MFGDENISFYCESYMDPICILGFKKLSGSLENISTYLQYHLRTPRSSLKKSWKISFFYSFSSQELKGLRNDILRPLSASEYDLGSKKKIKY